MALPADYVSGTITLTAGSTAFTGTGTGWLAADFREGDIILDVLGGGNRVAVVAAVTGNGAGTLTKPWEGPTLANVAYRLRYQWDSGRVSAQTRTLIEQLGNGNLQSLAAVTGAAGNVVVFNGPGAIGIEPRTNFINGVAYDVQVNTLADRAAYNGQSAGFTVLVSNVGDGRSAIYSKASNASGDWTNAAYITGPVGPNPTIAVDTTTTLPPGSSATVTSTPVTGGIELDFGIPAGEGFVARGAYSGATAYVKGDVVTDNGSSWIAKIATTGNAPPTLPAISNTWWDLLARAGTDGAGTVSSVGGGIGVTVDSSTPSTPSVYNPAPTLKSTTELIALSVPASIQSVRLLGFLASNDGGGHQRKRVTTAPAHGAGVRSTDRFLPNGTTDATNGGWWDVDESMPNEKMFGAVATKTNVEKTAAIQSLLNYSSTNKTSAFWVGRGYAITSTLNIPENVVIYGSGGPVFFNAGDYHVEKAFSGDLFTLGRAAQIQDLTVNGNGATYTGRGVVVTVGGDQRLLNCNFLYFAGAAVEFVGSNIGIRSQIIGGWYTNINDGGVAIRWPSETANGNRALIGVNGGVVDVAGSDNGTINGCNLSNIVFGATAKKIKVTGTRVANAAIPATMSLLGVDHVISGCVISGNVSIASTYTSVMDDNRIAGTITNPSVSNTNKIVVGPITYTPTWQGATTNPSIGNGTIEGEYDLYGSYCTVRIRIVIGSTTNTGSGVWSFSLPLPDSSSSRTTLGSAFVFDAGTSFLTGQSLIVNSRIQTLVGPNPANYSGSTTPISWAAGDRLEISIQYKIN